MALSAYSVTITKICNWALSAAGARNRITDIDVTEDTEEFRLCELFFWQAVMEAMQAGEWGFATERIGIEKDATDPTVGSYDFRFAVPSDSLLILFQIDKESDNKHYNYKREGGWILSNEKDEDDKAYIRYVKQITDVSTYPTLFIKAAYSNLAILIRDSLIGADEWYLRLVEAYDAILEKALGQSEMEDFAQEGNDDVINEANGDCGYCYRCKRPWGECTCY